VTTSAAASARGVIARIGLVIASERAARGFPAPLDDLSGLRASVVTSAMAATVAAAQGLIPEARHVIKRIFFPRILK
jgi:hypothetical protein